MRELTITTERRTQLVDITPRMWRRSSRAPAGSAVLVYVPHTTAGVTINEHADPAVARDFEAALERIGRRGLGLAAHRGGRGERPLAHPRRADGAAGGDPAPRRASSRSAPGRGSSSASSTARARARSTSPFWHRAVPGTSVPGTRLRLASTRGRPRQRDQEVELTVDSLAYGGNGVARLDGFVVFVRRGLPGDTVRARVTKVQRRHAEAIATDVVTPGPERVDAPCAHYPACGGCRFQDLAYDAQLAAKAAVGRATRCSGSPASPTRRSSRSSPPPRSSTTATRWSTRSRRATTAPTLGLHRAGPLGRGARDRALLADDRPRQRDPQPRCASWAREERLPGVRPGDAGGLPAAPRRPRGAEHGPGARAARDRARRALRPRAPDRGADRVPRGARRSTGR